MGDSEPSWQVRGFPAIACIKSVVSSPVGMLPFSDQLAVLFFDSADESADLRPAATRTEQRLKFPESLPYAGLHSSQRDM